MKASWTFLILWVLLVLGICVTLTEDRLAAATEQAATAPVPQNPAGR